MPFIDFSKISTNVDTIKKTYIDFSKISTNVETIKKNHILVLVKYQV